jgi:hypothetical protein
VDTLKSVSYDKIKKLCLFTRTKAIDVSNNKIYLKTKTSGNFLGFSKSYNNKKIEIASDGVYSYQPINVIYHQHLLLNIDGKGIQMSINNLDNRNSNMFEPSTILFMKPIDMNKKSINNIR